MPLVLSLLGLGFGILLNSLADNLPPDAENVRHPPRRPRCCQCGQAFRPVYWLALAHWLLRAGRCPRCGARRPIRPALVELVCAAALPYLWLWAAQPADGAFPQAIRFAAAAAVTLIFILIFVIDVEHRLILWPVVWPAAIALTLLGAVTPGHGLVKTLVGGLAGYALTLGIFLLAELFARVLKRLRGRALDAFSAVPYGPFLILGAMAIYLFGKDFAAVWLAAH